MLASNCISIGIKLYQYWHQIVLVLASKWKPPLNYFVLVKCTFCVHALAITLNNAQVSIFLSFPLIFRSLFKLLKPGESSNGPLPFWPRWVLRFALPNIFRWLFPLLVLWRQPRKVPMLKCANSLQNIKLCF